MRWDLVRLSSSPLFGIGKRPVLRDSAEIETGTEEGLKSEAGQVHLPCQVGLRHVALQPRRPVRVDVGGTLQGPLIVPGSWIYTTHVHSSSGPHYGVWVVRQTTVVGRTGDTGFPVPSRPYSRPGSAS